MCILHKQHFHVVWPLLAILQYLGQLQLNLHRGHHCKTTFTPHPWIKTQSISETNVAQITAFVLPVALDIGTGSSTLHIETTSMSQLLVANGCSVQALPGIACFLHKRIERPSLERTPQSDNWGGDTIVDGLFFLP